MAPGENEFDTPYHTLNPMRSHPAGNSGVEHAQVSLLDTEQPEKGKNRPRKDNQLHIPSLEHLKALSMKNGVLWSVTNQIFSDSIFY